MKKIVSMIITVMLVLSLAGCGGEPEHTLSYEGGKRLEVADRDCVAVFTKYTNGSSTSAVPADYLTVKAYQNGVEIPCLVPTGQKTEGYVQCDTSVQSGITADVVWIFQLEDSSPVEVELPDGKETIELIEE